jgi:D-alanyl-D-alanine dipeptidase
MSITFKQFYLEKYTPPWEKKTQKEKTAYVFRNLAKYIRKNNGDIIIFSAYSPKQALYIFKQHHPEYRFDDVDVIEYQKMVQNKNPIIPSKHSQPSSPHPTNPNTQLSLNFFK